MSKTENPNDTIDELILETLNDMHTQATTATPVVSITKNKSNKKYPLVSIAASFVLISAVGISAFLVSQSSSQGDSNDVIKDPIQSITTLTTNPTDDTSPTTSNPDIDDENPATTSPVQSAPGNTTTSPSIVMSPAGFEAYDHYKNAFGWYVRLRWNASATPGVSYCYFTSLNEINTQCEYNSNFRGTSGDYSVGIGNVNNNTFYLRAITQDGRKSEVVTVKYQIPAD